VRSLSLSLSFSLTVLFFFLYYNTYPLFSSLYISRVLCVYILFVLFALSCLSNVVSVTVDNITTMVPVNAAWLLRALARANVLPHHDVWFTKLTTSMAATTDRPTDRHTPRRALVAYALRRSPPFFLPRPSAHPASIRLLLRLSRASSRPMDPTMDLRRYGWSLEPGRCEICGKGGCIALSLSKSNLRVFPSHIR